MQPSLATPEPALPWYGIRTKPKFERVTATALENQGYSAYLPLCTRRRQWSDRTVETELPLFPGYLFCRFDVLQRLPILTTHGVIAIVGLGKTPEPIPDAEIDRIQAILRSGRNAEPWPYLRTGERVRILAGSLQGLEGLLVKKKNEWRIVISVDLLQRSVAVEVDRNAVTPV
jgi:transcription antitermination factor NusG